MSREAEAHTTVPSSRGGKSELLFEIHLMATRDGSTTDHDSDVIKEIDRASS